MAKRDPDKITLGSGHAFMMPFADTMPTKDELFIEDNRLGYIKGGCTLEYTEETTEEKDDLGYVSKIVTTNEEVLMKMGLLTWNGNSLQKLIDRCQVEEKDGLRFARIGGAGNAQGTYYAIGFLYEDKTDGNAWVMIKGRNSAGVSLAFATDTGTLIEPEFKAMPHDENGTLVQFIEEIGATA